MIEGQGWCLVENPKTASTAMRFALSGGHPRGGRHVALWGRTDPIRAIFVRNPFDRMVSAYYYKQSNKRLTFLEWLTSEAWAVQGMDIKRTSQTVWAHRCTHVFRFEQLAKEWARFLEVIGKDFIELPVKNAAKDRPHYRDVICDKGREIIEDRFRPDFDKWRYKWQ